MFLFEQLVIWFTMKYHLILNVIFYVPFDYLYLEEIWINEADKYVGTFFSKEDI